MSCPSGLHYSRILQVCTWPKEAGCVESAELVDEDKIISDNEDLLDSDESGRYTNKINDNSG